MLCIVWFIFCVMTYVLLRCCVLCITNTLVWYFKYYASFCCSYFTARTSVALCDRVPLMLYPRLKLMQLVVITYLILYLLIVNM